MTFKIFPFGINPEMDACAAQMGLAHWSCVSPMSNTWWVRDDGKECEYDNPQSDWMETLMDFDHRWVRASNVG